MLNYNINSNINEININDVNSLKKIQINSHPTDRQLKKLKKACADFEAIFYQLIFQSARKSISNDGIVKHSRAEEIFTDMMDSEISKQIAYRSENGIKDMLFNYFAKAMNVNKESKDVKIDLRG
jgi:flagellar protein FlgJ